MRRPKLIAIVAVLLAVPLLAWLGWRWWHPSFRVVARTPSPDGRFEYVVEWCPPPGLYASPNLYRGHVLDRSTGRAVPGTQWQANRDSCRVPDLEAPHAWTPGDLDALRAAAAPAPPATAPSPLPGDDPDRP